jgi:hypothetical protein
MEEQTPLASQTCMNTSTIPEKQKSMWRRDLMVLRWQSYKLAGVLWRKPLLLCSACGKRGHIQPPYFLASFVLLLKHAMQITEYMFRLAC